MAYHLGVVSREFDQGLLDEEMCEMKQIANGQWQDKSGKMINPGWTFFLRIAAEAVRRVNSMRDEHGISYSRKAMIRCGLARDLCGRWRKEQLFPHLQEIINKYPENFNGESIGTANVEDPK